MSIHRLDTATWDEVVVGEPIGGVEYSTTMKDVQMGGNGSGGVFRLTEETVVYSADNVSWLSFVDLVVIAVCVVFLCIAIHVLMKMMTNMWHKITQTRVQNVYLVGASNSKLDGKKKF